MSRLARLREQVDPYLRNRPERGMGAEIIDLATRKVLPSVKLPEPTDRIGMVAGIGIVAALGALTLWMMNTAPEPRKGNATQQADQFAFDSAGLPLPIIPVLPLADSALPDIAGDWSGDTLAAPDLSPVLAAPPGMAFAPEIVGNPNDTPTIVFDSGEGGANEGTGVAFAGPADISPPAMKASSDPGRLVTQGTLIPAVLETAIDTDIPGYVRAIVSTDVRSFDGKRLLVPRSTRLIGEYKSDRAAGETLAYVVWKRLIRPDGVTVNIPSASGFGSAQLQSVIGTSGKSSAAIRVRQGEPIRIFTARDIDLSKST